MSLLENLKPTKETKTFEITVFAEDMDVFSAIPEFLKKKHKGQGEYTQAVIFEQLIQQVKEDKDLMSFSKKRKKRKSKEAIQ